MIVATTVSIGTILLVAVFIAVFIYRRKTTKTMIPPGMTCTKKKSILEDEPILLYRRYIRTSVLYIWARSHGTLLHIDFSFSAARLLVYRYYHKISLNLESVKIIISYSNSYIIRIRSARKNLHKLT